MAESVIAQQEPFGIDVEQGKEYWWCQCGRSASQPFCDGSHKGTGLAPLQYIAKRNQTVWFCGCKRTSNKPVCDGTHSTL